MLTIYKEYCKELKNLPENSGVRSAGASAETSDNEVITKSYQKIIEYNKRPCRKGIKYINNKLQNILFIIDMVFETQRQMENDIKAPKPLNLEGFVKSLLK